MQASMQGSTITYNVFVAIFRTSFMAWRMTQCAILLHGRRALLGETSCGGNWRLVLLEYYTSTRLLFVNEKAGDTSILVAPWIDGKCGLVSFLLAPKRTSTRPYSVR